MDACLPLLPWPYMLLVADGWKDCVSDILGMMVFFWRKLDVGARNLGTLSTRPKKRSMNKLKSLNNELM